LVTYNPTKDEITLIEAKSYLNSTGVTIGGLSGTDKKTKDRYRMLNNATYRKIVTARLKADFIKRNIINKTTRIKYALAAGQVQKKNRYLQFKPSKTKPFPFFQP